MMELLKKTLFIVDGPSEVEALNDRFSKFFMFKPSIRRANCNGKDVTAAGYANKIFPLLIAAMSGPFLKIVCILDREFRKCSAVKFANEVHDEISTKFALHKFPTKIIYDLKSKLKVIVADQMFENWIVSDIRSLTGHPLVSRNIEQENFDGKNGVAILKKLTNNKYKKMSHCSALFNRTKFCISSSNSPSFEIFYSIFT